LSQFEFVLVVVAIVAGFSISAILAGWGRHLLAPPEERPSGLQYLASLVLLFQTIRYIWVLWDFRAMDWLFLSFFLALLPVLVIALAAHVISIPGDRNLRGLELYFSRARLFFLLQAIQLATWAVFDIYHLGLIRETVTEGFLPVFFALRASGIVAFLWLTYSRRSSHHWIVLSVVLGTLVYFSLTMLTVLPS
jgi:hypothetical protein